jgi:hypothetical protein
MHDKPFILGLACPWTCSEGPEDPAILKLRSKLTDGRDKPDHEKWVLVAIPSDLEEL